MSSDRGGGRGDRGGRGGDRWDIKTDKTPENVGYLTTSIFLHRGGYGGRGGDRGGRGGGGW